MKPQTLIRYSIGCALLLATGASAVDHDSSSDFYYDSSFDSNLLVPQEFSSIQAAIDAAVEGDTVTVAAGTYFERIDFLGKAISVVGAGAENTVVDASSLDSTVYGGVVRFMSGEGPRSVLRGFTLTGGHSWSGGGVAYSNSSATLTHCTIIGNSSNDAGGGVYCESSTPTIGHSLITGNTARSVAGGGVYCLSSNTTIDHCAITNNLAEDLYYPSGGGIYSGGSSSSLTVSNSRVSGNTAYFGGGMLCWGGNGTITNTEISNNSGGIGGGIKSPHPISLAGCTISGNTASFLGGGGYFDGDATLVDCTISGNSAGSIGGGIDCSDESSPALTNCTISENSAEDGGGVSFRWDSTPTLTDCTISNNSAEYDGGGIFALRDSHATLANCSISNNSAQVDGGGIWTSNSDLTLANCTISENSAEDDGGGIWGWTSHPTLLNCTISKNAAYDNGGGIANDGDATLINCMISANWAEVDGGGIYNSDGHATLRNCTISDNSSGSSGGGVYSFLNRWVTTTATNTILWSNTPDQAVQLSATYSNVEGGHPGEGNIGANPRFISAHGFDYVLAPKSPCIDAGTGANDGVDWSRIHRRYGVINSEAPDMGAYGGPAAAGWLD